MPPARVRELGEMYELVEEILLLIPPEEPAVLIHASLVCKAWCRLLSSHAFHSRYHTLHKTPPVLCFLQRWEDNVERFVPTTKFRPRNPERRDSYVLDCRHGRILLGCRWYDEGEEDDEEEEADEQLEEEEDDIEEDGEGEEADKEEEEYDTDEEGEEDDDEDEDEGEEDDRVLKMVVWDPVSGGRTKLRSPDIFDPDVNGATYWGTVLCAADGCNHASCNLGPFFVALIGLDSYQPYDDDDKRLWASVYSSESREWTSTASIHIGGVGRFEDSIIGRPSVFVGQALHFLLHGDPTVANIFILKYDFRRHRLSVIDLPEPRVSSWTPLLISADDGGLGLVHLDQDGLCSIWSVEVSVDGVASCIQLKETDLKTLVPIGNPMSSDSLKLVGWVEGTDIIIAVTDLGVFTVDLKSLRLRKLSSKPYNFTFKRDSFNNLFLYTSFNNPPAVAGVVDEDNPRPSKAGRIDGGSLNLEQAVEAWKFSLICRCWFSS
ncbi:uncharacterized protein LOC119340076 isoform X2 [Triticum dicoccoides]|uniref:uncharacterized protein LOC119340076 isoform X2 n=1 Tax=Triticum dicoccoides TaxID=85692 RepID=UPI0018916354|nr:uncharacterized protein LOC119340076 isoform X2 [Triticum dicoccoides]